MSEATEIPSIAGPHAGGPVVWRQPDSQPQGALILVHGRYATADSMLSIADALKLSDWLVVAPQAAKGTWYPFSFLAPFDQNEPFLTSGLDLLDAVVTSVKRHGIEEDRIVLMGFSQGACLALEYTARSQRRLGGVVGLSGGLIGPPGTTFSYEGSCAGLNVFLGCSDVDPHIPIDRVRETERVLAEMGATVTAKIYPGMGHTISADELKHSVDLLRTVAGEPMRR